jgi:hypothetical protein
VTTAAVMLVALSAFGAGDGEPVSVSMVAVDARNENRSSQYFGPGLESSRKALSGLGYDTFLKVRSAEVPSPFGEEQKIYINDTYTLYVTPESVRDDGRIRLRARIEATSRDGKQKKNALDTTLLIAPGSYLNLGGLPLEEGSLILVISVK